MLLVILSLMLPSATAQLILRDVNGAVEQQRSGWVLARSGETVTQALRTGLGRATLQNPLGAQLLMGSNSALTMYENEPSLQQGHFYLQGKGRFYVNGIHYFTDGRVRIDLQDNVQRIGVIAGSLRIAVNTQVSSIRAGQQYDLKTLQTSPFAESDPWYLWQFNGAGQAQIEAVSGSVTLQGPAGSHAVQPVEDLQPGQVLITAENSWAEVGFTGGGYLRLQPNSALSVLSVEKTSRGREVQLKLLRGSAWNVVSKGQGGYQITTPTVTTAVRGTTFRVDASGTVKVFDGVVTLPSQHDLSVPAGKEVLPGGQPAPLSPKQSDLDNQALDAIHNQPLKLSLDLPQVARDLSVRVQSQPSSQVTLRLTPRGQPPLPDFKLRGQDGNFSAQRDLPEGSYQVEVFARRFGQTRKLSAPLLVDRQPPQLSVQTLKQRGRVALLRLKVCDASGVRLSIMSGPQNYSRHLRAQPCATTEWTLPFFGSLPLSVRATDQAGNVSTLTVPLQSQP